MTTLSRWIKHSWVVSGEDDGVDRRWIELTALRCSGLLVLVVFLVLTVTTAPRPGLHGRGVLVLISMLVLLGGVGYAAPQRVALPARRQIVALLLITVGAAGLGTWQPNGYWAAPVYVAVILSAIRLPRRAGVVMLVLCAGPFFIGMLVKAQYAGAVGFALAVVPWFLVMRLLIRLRDQRDLLEATRVSEAREAVFAERGRIAREMHDVLAHSLSALALQLETARLLARSVDADAELTRAIDRSHHLAASGLDDARRAIAAARGDTVPGPDGLRPLAEAFGEQSGLPVDLSVTGEACELAPDARLAVFRTAQEALTNVRRHAAADRVAIRLAYLPDRTVLVVEDHAPPGTPPPAPLDGVSGAGYGLTGMRERAELLGGELEASPTLDGFRVELRLPR